MLYFGIDLHSKQITVCVRNESGEITLRRQLSTRPEKIGPGKEGQEPFPEQDVLQITQAHLSAPDPLFHLFPSKAKRSTANFFLCGDFR